MITNCSVQQFSFLQLFLIFVKENGLYFMTKKIKSYTEAELIKMFGLERLGSNDAHPLMQEWTHTSTELNAAEQYFFDDITDGIVEKVVG